MRDLQKSTFISMHAQVFALPHFFPSIRKSLTLVKLRSPLDGQPSHPGVPNSMTHPFPIIPLPNLTASKAHF